jgi:hypothetical protein
MADADGSTHDDDDGNEEFLEWFLAALKVPTTMILNHLAGKFNGYGLTPASLRHVRAELDSLMKFIGDAEVIVRDQRVIDQCLAWARYVDVCKERGVTPGDNWSDAEYGTFRERAIPWRIQYPSWRGNKKLRDEVDELYSDKSDGARDA